MYTAYEHNLILIHLQPFSGALLLPVPHTFEEQGMYYNFMFNTHLVMMFLLLPTEAVESFEEDIQHVCFY